MDLNTDHSNTTATSSGSHVPLDDRWLSGLLPASNNTLAHVRVRHVNDHVNNLLEGHAQVNLSLERGYAVDIVGQFRRGKLHGIGSITRSKGDELLSVMSGQWHEGIQCGHVCVTSFTGRKPWTVSGLLPPARPPARPLRRRTAAHEHQE